MPSVFSYTRFILALRARETNGFAISVGDGAYDVPFMNAYRSYNPRAFALGEDACEPSARRGNARGGRN